MFEDVCKLLKCHESIWGIIIIWSIHIENHLRAVLIIERNPLAAVKSRSPANGGLHSTMDLSGAHFHLLPWNFSWQEMWHTFMSKDQNLHMRQLKFRHYFKQTWLLNHKKTCWIILRAQILCCIVFLLDYIHSLICTSFLQNIILHYKAINCATYFFRRCQCPKQHPVIVSPLVAVGRRL